MLNRTGNGYEFLDANPTRKRIATIYRLGLEIQKEYPELYRRYFDKTFKEIAQSLKSFDNKYSNLHIGILTNAVRHAIIGFEENEFHEGYSGQLTPEKYEELRHCGGKICYEKGSGLFRLSKKELADNGAKNISYLMQSKGHQIWLPQEKERFFQLRDDPNYQKGKRPSYKLICEQLQRDFPYRKFTPKGLEGIFQREKRSGQSKQKKNPINWSQQIADPKYGTMELIELAYFYSQEKRYEFARNKIKVSKLAADLSKRYGFDISEHSMRKALGRYKYDVEKGKRDDPQKISTPQLEVRSNKMLEELLEDCLN